MQPSAEGFEGKTYSLRPDGFASDGYYDVIGEVADRLLQDGPALSHLLDTVRWLGAGKRNIRRLLTLHRSTPDTRLLQTLRSSLSQYTTSASDHLRKLRAFDRLDRTLTTTEEQHHLFMLEIELGNRLYAEAFRKASTRIAMLPHCLRDLDADCRAATRDIDYICKGCTDACNVNLASKVLRFHKVQPYIWMEADLKSLFRNLRRNGATVGVLGIACVPELAKGMRMCHNHDAPAIGVPLDANRCGRWWGRFYPNTVNLDRLERLLT